MNTLFNKGICLLLIFIFISCSKPGIIQGMVDYPNKNNIPDMNIYLINSETDEVLTLFLHHSTKMEYKFDNVPVGRYKIYASPQKTKTYTGGYTGVVPCKLGDNCLEHGLLEFEVGNGANLTNINIDDWGMDMASRQMTWIIEQSMSEN